MICSLCDARCCKNRVITITAFDMLRIKERGHKLEEFVVLRKPDILNYDERDLLICKEGEVEMEFLLTIKSHPCVFLKDNRCSIYEYAPLVCRVYPFNIKNKVMGYALCPFIAKQLFKIRGQDKKEIILLEREEKEHQKIVKEWNKIKRGKKECIIFMLEEAKRRFKNIGNVINIK